jgi:Zn-dependent protease with chaperone function
MHFVLQGLTLALAWFLIINVSASGLVAFASTRRAEARSPAGWFALRILPGSTAILFVALVFVPAYWRYEPRETLEGFDVTLTTCAVLAAVLLAAAAFRGFAAWRRAAVRVRAWMGTACPLPIVELPRRTAESGIQHSECGVSTRTRCHLNSKFRMPTSPLQVQDPASCRPWRDRLFSAALLHTRVSAFVVDAERPAMALVGVLRPRLLVTRGLINALSDEELSACIAHELGHCRAWDNFKRLAMRAAPDALFGTSAARALERRWAAASEHAADDIAGEHGAAARCALASALVKVARLMPEDRVVAEPISTLVGGGEIAARVRRLLDDRAIAPAPGRRRLRVASAAAVVAIGATYGPLLKAVHYATELLVHSLP